MYLCHGPSSANLLLYLYWICTPYTAAKSSPRCDNGFAVTAQLGDGKPGI